ncbi:M20/M25/M40 family metallo-hydrolase [Amycolatopsis pithecellobii]|uniref:M20/M25/M40 family metallo-hydrolase n=1 Tax=Amycolatopsis pithecellobii TaxID=664692 RepID=A0A6N7YZR2_9PSEU|nr:M20/M25/M40 family metallo-hydrolase [Amycolatopsis pithecellobii]MTD52584.1 M20/M25/M40 family metallo-hydrolase [Amycolatopsis pithecellobii]
MTTTGNPLADSNDARVDDAALIELARGLAATPSQSGNERRAIELVTDAMRTLGFEVTVDRSGNAIGTIGQGRAGASRLLIDGHIDSIPLHSEDSWRVDPFGGVLEDDRLFGLGICDQKASIAAAIHGVAARRARLADGPGLVAVVASVCEEHMEGAALAEAVELVQPTAVITTEPNDTRLAVGQRGRAKVEVEVLGRACHAGHAGEGVNAAEGVAALIDAVRRVARPHHPQLGYRDITCIDVTSWPYPSVSTVPGRALARFDARFLPGETEESLHELLRSAAAGAWAEWAEPPSAQVRTVAADFTTYTGARYVVGEFAHAWWTDGPIVESAQRALATAGLDPTPMSYSFCTNGSYTAGKLSIPTIGFGVGEEHIAHQANEYVTLSSLRRGAKGLSALSVELTGA